MNCPDVVGITGVLPILEPVRVLTNVITQQANQLIARGMSERLGQSVEACLGRFGRYWVRFAERGSYGHILDFTGSDLVSFIQNLDRMHQAVLSAMPAAQVPSFSVVRHEDGKLRVKHNSERAGLEPFVVGLLQGLLDRFGLEGEVEQVESMSNSAEFAVVYR